MRNAPEPKVLMREAREKWDGEGEVGGESDGAEVGKAGEVVTGSEEVSRS